MAGIAALERFAGGPGRFLGFDFIRHVTHVVAIAHRIENEELGLGAEVRGVADAGRLQIRLGALGERARIARIGLHRAGLEHIALQEQGLVGHERIDDRAIRIRQQHHVRFVDALPAGDRRTVEHLAVLEQRFFDGMRGKRKVVLLAEHIGEAQIDEFDFVFLDQFFDVGCGHGNLGGIGCIGCASSQTEAKVCHPGSKNVGAS